MGCRLAAGAVLVIVVASLSTSDAATVRWEMGAGALVFNPDSASVVGLESGQRELGIAGSGCPIFAVRMWPAEDQPFGNVSLGPGHGWEDSESVAIPDDEWKLVPHWGPRGPFVYRSATGLVAMLTLETGRDETLQLNITLQNSMPAGALYVSELIFPRLCGVTATATSELVTSGGPRGTGLRVPDPVRNIGSAQLQWFKLGYSPYVQSDSYPHAMMNWLAVASPNSALYVGIHDPALKVTSVRAGATTNSSISLEMSANATTAVMPASGSLYIRPSVLSLVQAREGNSSFAQWHSAAKIYRRWLEADMVPVTSPRHPTWLRQGFAGIDISGDFPQQYYGQRETEIDAPWFYGLEILNVWGHAINPQCCPGFPAPDPGRGGADGFKAYVQRLQAAGIRVGTYFESECSNPVFSNVSSFRGQVVSELPRSQRPPPLNDLLAHAAMVAPGWAHSHGGNLDPGPTGEWGLLPGNYKRLVTQINEQDGTFADVAKYKDNLANHSDTHVLLPMHYSQDRWFQDYLGSWLEFYGRQMGTDAPYLDQLGFFPTGPNYDQSGMLPAFGDGDAPRRILDFLKTVMKSAFPRQNEDQTLSTPLFFTYEGYTDSYGAAGGGALLSGHRDIPCTEVCDDVSKLMEERCALCVQHLPWISANTTGIVAAFEVARATFPQHAVFVSPDREPVFARLRFIRCLDFVVRVAAQEGTCNVGPSTPIALHAVAHGFCDGHKADLTTFSAGSYLGYLPPLVWLREGVAPWIQSEQAEYWFTSGVLSSPMNWIVRHHRGIDGSGTAIWSMFLYHNPDGAEGQMVLQTGAPSLWYILESTGDGRVLSECEAKAECTMQAFRGRQTARVASNVGAVLAVSLEATTASLPVRSLSFLRLELPQPRTPVLVLTTVNVGNDLLDYTVPIVEYANGEPGVVPLTAGIPVHVPPHAVEFSTVTLEMTGRNLPARLEVALPGVLGPVRRLAPVPIADPYFGLRRFASGTIIHPDAADADGTLPPDGLNTSAFAMLLQATGSGATPPLAGDMLTSAYRHVYWPPGMQGVIHIRMKAVAQASNLSVPLNAGLRWQPRNESQVVWASLCVFRPSPSMGWVVGQVPFIGIPNMSWVPLTIAMAGGPLQIPGLIRRNASLLVDKLEVLPVGAKPVWIGSEGTVNCSPQDASTS